MKRILNWMIWLVTGALVVTIVPNLPTIAQTAPAQPVYIAQATAQDQISRIVVNELEKDGGNAQASVWSVKVVGNYALAHWLQGEAGGQALLRRANNQWILVQLGGGAMDVSTLRQLGVPDDATARSLLAE
ncbi:hypothetical protein [Leptolyngbya ohadii]|uniref:hypothetical protein n=1 Tax=Leptolyngbya ohadii TaxID=1962290 RepID=UPI000B59EE92|nr:hypothetical protein [Leptolyngbya ohadii]